MKGIAHYFFLLAVICVSLGMGWGIYMAASGNHELAGAHAHLNLVGWVTMGMFGVYYHLVPAAAATGLARFHFGLALAGVVTMVPGIALAISGGTEALAVLGSFLTIGSMLVFLFTVLRNGGQAA